MKEKSYRTSLCSRRPWGRAKVFLVVSIFLGTCTLSSADSNQGLRCYSYISPPAAAVLEKFGISDMEIENFTRKEVNSRAILPVGANRLYEGAEDSLRIDIRRKSHQLLIELSVRQGGSIHNMLERWSARRLLPIKNNMSSKEVSQAFFASIAALLDDLKSKYNSPEYQQGAMIPEDYVSEKDE